MYRFAEPAVGGAPGQRAAVPDIDTLNLTYPDGPHDAEALMVDPVDGDLVIITKDWTLAGSSGVYRAPGDLADGSTSRVQRVATLTEPPATLVTAADVSPDGSIVAVRSYVTSGSTDGLRVSRCGPRSLAEPCRAPVPTELQGESLGFAADGTAYLTLSEGKQPVLHRTAPSCFVMHVGASEPMDATQSGAAGSPEERSAGPAQSVPDSLDHGARMRPDV